jgi:hypothetical protein
MERKKVWYADDWDPLPYNKNEQLYFCDDQTSYFYDKNLVCTTRWPLINYSWYSPAWQILGFSCIVSALLLQMNQVFFFLSKRWHNTPLKMNRHRWQDKGKGPNQFIIDLDHASITITKSSTISDGDSLPTLLNVFATPTNLNVMWTITHPNWELPYFQLLLPNIPSLL